MANNPKHMDNLRNFTSELQPKNKGGHGRKRNFDYWLRRRVSQPLMDDIADQFPGLVMDEYISHWDLLVMRTLAIAYSEHTSTKDKLAATRLIFEYAGKEKINQVPTLDIGAMTEQQVDEQLKNVQSLLQLAKDDEFEHATIVDGTNDQSDIGQSQPDLS